MLSSDRPVAKLLLLLLDAFKHLEDCQEFNEHLLVLIMCEAAITLTINLQSRGCFRTTRAH